MKSIPPGTSLTGSTSTQNRLKYDFTQDWFDANIPRWDALLNPLRFGPIQVLEIGAFEGASTTWILEDLFTHPESRLTTIDPFKGTHEYAAAELSGEPELQQITRFYKNVHTTGKLHQLIVMQSFSYEALIQLSSHKLAYFDFIYIDGGHAAYEVLSDVVLAWPLLKEGGILILDDYKWNYFVEAHNNPEIAINAFLACFKPDIEIVEIGHQVVLKKLPATARTLKTKTSESAAPLSSIKQWSKRLLARLIR